MNGSSDIRGILRNISCPVPSFVKSVRFRYNCHNPTHHLRFSVGVIFFYNLTNPTPSFHASLLSNFLLLPLHRLAIICGTSVPWIRVGRYSSLTLLRHGNNAVADDCCTHYNIVDTALLLILRVLKDGVV